MAAGEDQARPVVAHGALLDRFVLRVQKSGLGVAVRAGRLAAELIDRPVASGGDDPPGRARGEPGGWPALHRRGERVLHRFLGDVDVAEDADQDGHRATVLLAEDTFDLRRCEVRHVRVQSSASPWKARTRMDRLPLKTHTSGALPWTRASTLRMVGSRTSRGGGSPSGR